MQRAILRIQWMASWHLVLALAVAAFALPIVSVHLSWHSAQQSLPFFLEELQLWGYLYPMLALAAAIVLALSIWTADHRGHHVYATLLPLPRWRYVLLRYVAGLVLMLPVVVCLWIGALIAAHGMPDAPGLRTFSGMIALKFALSVLVLFGIVFALASASARTLGIALRVVGLFLVVHVAVLLLVPGTNLLWDVVSALASAPGPLAPLAGRWMLIDA